MLNPNFKDKLVALNDAAADYLVVGAYAKAAVNDLLSRPADDFDRAAKSVLDKNRELYRRLS